MDVTALIDVFRTEVRDNVRPYLFSDEEILRYIDQAQDMFMRQTGGVADASSAATVIDVVAGDPWADISPLVLKVRMATLASTGQVLQIINAEDFLYRQSQNAAGISVDTSTGMNSLPGTPKAMYIGMEDGRVRWDCAPVANDTVNMVIYRGAASTIDALDSVLDIPAQHHMHLLHYVKYRAYSKQDADTFNGPKAQEHNAAFTDYCKYVAIERVRRDHKPRAVAYGGV